jgi:hypothetical protein
MNSRLVRSLGYLDKVTLEKSCLVISGWVSNFEGDVLVGFSLSSNKRNDRYPVYCGCFLRQT